MLKVQTFSLSAEVSGAELGSVKEEKEIEEECEGITGGVCVLRNRRRSNSAVTRSPKPGETVCQHIAAEGSEGRRAECRHEKEEAGRVTVYLHSFLPAFTRPSAAPHRKNKSRRSRIRV